jgi:gamma-glutamyl phosphate reductase
MDENESITKELREYVRNPLYCATRNAENVALSIADRIDKQVDALKADNAELQARLDASMPLPVDADGIPCHIGDLLETEHHIPRKVVGYYLAYESNPCVTLDFISLSIKASRLHHVATEPPESQDKEE